MAKQFTAQAPICGERIRCDPPHQFQGRTQGRGGTGFLASAQWLHDGPQYYSVRRVLKIAENRWAVGAPPRTLLAELTALPRPLSWLGGGLLPPPKEPHLRCRPSALRSCPQMKNPGRALDQFEGPSEGSAYSTLVSK